MEKRNLSYLIFILLCKRERRQQILCKWHAKQPFEGNNGVEIMTKFINIVLHEPVRIQMTHTALSLWRGKLEIPYTWMTVEERSLIVELYKHHEILFTYRQRYEGNCFKFTRCTLNTKLYDMYSLQHRRELIRDFAAICITIRKSESIWFRWLLIRCCQEIMMSRNRTDRFVYELHHQLQANRNVINIPVI